MATIDIAQRFLFDHTDIRGELVTLEQSYQEALAAHNYPAPIKELLGELAAASVLLSTTLKYDGVMTLQARSQGPLKLLMVECTHDRSYRLLARWEEELTITDQSLTELMPEGQILITVDPTRGKRYQGIVPLQAESLAECFEQYFSQSEQLPTRLWLCANHQRANGMLLQALPPHAQLDTVEREQAWNNLLVLAKTLTPEELQSLDHTTILTRLFHQEEVRVLDGEAVTFHCSCSRDRCEKILLNLGREEIDEIVESEGEVAMDCQFCSHKYRFAKADVDKIFTPTAQPKPLH